MFFKDIYGNTAVKHHLVRMVEDNRLSHAILFSGQEGDAKLQLAIAFAAYLNCEHPHDGDACGECPSCIQMKKLSHPELHFIFPIAGSVKKSSEPSSSDHIEEWRDFINKTDGLGTLSDWYDSIGVTTGQGIINANDCNNIIRALSYTSYQSKYKVVIMWMIERLFHAAAPKLLKILEEPPEDTLFILITEDRSAILDTILSRTQTLNIPAFTANDVSSYLKARFNIPAEEAAKFAEFSDGNAAMAVNMVLSPETNSNFFDEFIQWMRICLQADMLKILPFVDDFSKNSREKVLMFLRSSLSLLRQALYLNTTGKMSIPIPESQMATFTKFAQFVSPSNITIFNTAINQTISRIERNGLIPLLMTNLTINLCRAFKKK